LRKITPSKTKPKPRKINLRYFISSRAKLISWLG
jgi:hypothetical protein